MLRRLRQHPWSRRVGAGAGRAGRQASLRLLDRVLPVSENVEASALRDVRRILVVRPNFRIGNTLMAGPIVLALRARFPEARIDYLGGDTTAGLLAHLPLDRVHSVSRRHVVRPWRFVALFVRLRRERYDLAVEGGLGSFSGGLYAYLTGARNRLGCAGKGDRFLTVRLAPISTPHAYDGAVELARRLGVECPDRPVYRVSELGVKTAAALLAESGLVHEGRVAPFVVLFVGGHEGKRWPAELWVDLAQRLCRTGLRVLVAVGPEETSAIDGLRAALPAEAKLMSPHPLDVFAGVLAAAALVVTPDSGPMHLAVALATPTIALLLSERSQMYAPRGVSDRSLLRPSAAEVAAAVLEHPAVRGA